MKRMILVLLAAAVLLCGCSLFGSDDSGSSAPDSSSAPSSSSVPDSSQPEDSSQAQDSSQASGSIPAGDSTPTSGDQSAAVQDVSGWIGSYAMQPGSAGQVTLVITAGSTEGSIHFVLDAKGLTYQGDALVYAEQDALCKELGNLTLHLERSGITVTEGEKLNSSANFSGYYEK